MAEEILATKNFLEVLNSVDKEWGSWHDDLKQCESEIIDLLHEIEFTKFDAYRGYKLCKEIQDVRQRRRKIKEKMEILRGLKDFETNNKNMKINLYKVLTNMEKIKENQGNRMYTPRVRTDLKVAERGEAG